MVTRRIVLGTGMAFATLAGAASFGAYAPTVRRQQDAAAIDALLVDESVEMHRDIADLVTASKWNFPIVGIQLDAAAHARLMRVLDDSRCIAGISSGATLFCLERIAWDHSFRLTGRSELIACGPGHARQDVAAFLGGAPSIAGSSMLARAYRPSRADGTLHAWIMQKSARPPLRQSPQERRSK